MDHEALGDILVVLRKMWSLGTIKFGVNYFWPCCFQWISEGFEHFLLPLCFELLNHWFLPESQTASKFVIWVHPYPKSFCLIFGPSYV
jgi:hypothetical protein